MVAGVITVVVVVVVILVVVVIAFVAFQVFVVVAAVVEVEKKVFFYPTMSGVILGLYQSPVSLKMHRRALFCSSTLLIIPSI